MKIRVGMVFRDFDWDGPCDVVVLQVERGYCLIAKLGGGEVCWLKEQNEFDENEIDLLLESELLFAGVEQ